MWNKIPAISKIGAIGKLGDAPKLKGIPLSDIVTDPQAPGEKDDPLEAAAMQDVDASLPERIIWKWLDRQALTYQVEHWLMGGRSIIGGSIVDFVVYGLANKPVVLRVQGEYWHSAAMGDIKAKDDAQASRLRQAGYLVVDLWEEDIYRAVLGNYLNRWLWQQITA